MFDKYAVMTVVICIVAVIAANQVAKKCRANPNMSMTAKLLIPIGVLAVAFAAIFFLVLP